MTIDKRYEGLSAEEVNALKALGIAFKSASNGYKKPFDEMIKAAQGKGDSAAKGLGFMATSKSISDLLGKAMDFITNTPQAAATVGLATGIPLGMGAHLFHRAHKKRHPKEKAILRSIGMYEDKLEDIRNELAYRKRRDSGQSI